MLGLFSWSHTREMTSHQKCVGCFPELLVDALDVVEAAEAFVANEAAAGGLGNFVLNGRQQSCALYDK